MKILLVLCIANFLLLTCGNPLPELSSDDHTPGKIQQLYKQHYSSYRKYLKEFNKKHDMSVPEPIRLLKFVEASKMIEEHNERYKQGLETYEMGLNEMSDWTEEEEKSLYGFDPENFKQSKSNNTLIFSQKQLKPLPASVDYRRFMAPIKNQGRCNVCYIFSAVAAVEAYTAMKTGKSVVPLSEQQVMDCAVGSGMGKCAGRGGVPEFVWDWLATTKGLMSAADYPYRTRDNRRCFYNPAKAQANVFGYATLRWESISALKHALAFHGPVAISLHAGSRSFRRYKRGIYEDATCPSDGAYSSHSVLAVGYGEEGDDEYIIIRNSWGPNWGEGGYARILASPLFICGVGRYGTVPLFN